MKVFRLISEYRWPIYIGGHLMMSVIACGVLVWVATRPDAPRPIPNYYQSAQSWDVDEAAIENSRALGWAVHYELPADVPYVPGMPRPVDVTITDRSGKPVSGLSGTLFAIRPSDGRLNQSGSLVEVPAQGNYRTLVRLDEPGAWDFKLDTQQHSLQFVHAARITVPAVHDVPGVATR